MLEAADYCAFYGKRLPTIEEWTFAARKNTDALYAWGDDPILDRGRYRANYRSPRSKSGRREFDKHIVAHSTTLINPLGDSPFGVSHMTGNVREWVVGHKHNHGWVIGGGWKSRLHQLKVTDGEYLNRFTAKEEDVGFRCAQSIKAF